MANNTTQNETMMLNALRDMVVSMEANARKLDLFVTESASVLPDLRTDLALIKQVQTAHQKAIDDIYLMLNKGDNSLATRSLIMQQEVKELYVRTSNLVTIVEKINHLQSEQTVQSKELADMKEKPKTLRENANSIAQWIAILAVAAMWLWDKFHK